MYPIARQRIHSRGAREQAEVLSAYHAILKTLYKPDYNYFIWLGLKYQVQSGS